MRKKLKLGQTLIIAMANLRPKDTGLPMVIWVQPETGKEKHGPRIKVQKEHGDKVDIDNWATVTVSKPPRLIGKLNPKDQKLVFKFVELNFTLLQQLWEDIISPVEFANNLKKV